MKPSHWMFMVGLFALFMNVARSQTLEDAFNRGNELYRASKYREAIKDYESIIHQGYMSPELYFNLGNAYYRNEQLARAILSYERAAQLQPNDPDIEHNLKLVYLKTIDRLEPVPEMFFIQWLRAIGSLMSPDTVRIFFVTSWILLFCSLAIMYFVVHPRIFRSARVLFLISFICVVLWVCIMGIQSFRETAQDKAVITAQTVTAKSSPDANGVDAFVIHEGLKVKLTDSVGDWMKILLMDGKVGWISAGQCERI